MISENLNIYDDLINIYDFIDVEKVFSKDKELNYYKTVFNNSSNKINKYEKSLDDADKVSIKTYQDIQNQYIYTYANDFIYFFQKIFTRNENETYSENDSISTKNEKDVLYENRMIDIIPYKIALLKNISNIKRFKGSLKYIELIVDFYVRLKYGNQLYTNNNELNDILTSGTLDVGTRYKLYEGSYLNYVSGNIFSVSSSDIITGFSVIPQFVLNVNKIDNTLYELNTIISLGEWETILKPIVHPLGWNDIFTQISTSFNNISYLVQHKNNIIVDRKDRYINIGYNNQLDNFYKLYEISNISFVDGYKTNFSGIKNGCYTLNINL